MDKTIKVILESSVHDEVFLVVFYKMLEKFATEYDNMAQMEAIKKAGELLELFNQ